MVYYVYIIYSSIRDKFYIGQTDNIETRIESHNSGNSPYTSSASDWRLVYHEKYGSRIESRKRENEIKSKKSRKYIEWLVSASSRQKSGWRGDRFESDILHRVPEYAGLFYGLLRVYNLF